MFGYVLPDQPELKIKEFALYRCVYCSLCEALRGFGVGAKLLLNYDFTFAAMLSMSVRNEEPEFYSARCSVNPFVRERLIKTNSSLTTCAAALIICSKYKLEDNLRDERFGKRLISKAAEYLLGGSFKKAEALLPEFNTFVKSQIKSQNEFESSLQDNIDLSCNPTARMLSDFFAMMSDDKEQSRILARLGYLVGRYVYLADALDDLSSDVKKMRFNPFAVRFKLDSSASREQIAAAASEAKSQLYHSVGEIESCYRFLQLRIFVPVLDNIIYYGLRARVSQLTGFGPSKKGYKIYGQSISDSRS